MPVGSCVISRGSSAGGSGSGSGAYGGYSSGYSSASSVSYGSSARGSSSNKSYVDNAYNRNVGRVGMPVGSCVISRGSSTRGDGSGVWSGYSSASASHVSYGTSAGGSSSTRTYVDNPSNRRLGRVGETVGSMPVSRNSSSTSRSSNSVSSGHSSSKTYVDNSYNRQHGRVGLPVGSMVISKSGSSSRSSETSYRSGTGVKVYVDNSLNRRLGRVGKQVGTMVYSKKSSGSDGPTQSGRTYVDNSLNRRLGRVGKPLGSQPYSKTSKDTQERKLWIEKLKRDDSELLDIHDTGLAAQYPDMCYTPENNAALEEAIWYLNRKLEEIKWETETKPQTSKKSISSKSLVNDYVGENISFQEIELGKQIGQGGFGDVYAAKWRGSTVAVKKLRVQRVSKRRLQDFTDEVLKFCKLDHPNIVKFIGACVVTPNLAIVMEYMQSNLFDALHLDDTVDFSDEARWSILRQTTFGLSYLHQNKMAHCDLKSQNVLLNDVSDENVVAKITDFGLSMVKNDTETSQSQRPEELVRNIGTPRYSAPEVLRGEYLSAKAMMRADMYSLALIIYEVMFEEEPFYNMSYAQLQ